MDKQTALLIATLAKDDEGIASLIEKYEAPLRPKAICQCKKKRGVYPNLTFSPCPNETDLFQPCQWCAKERLLDVEYDCPSCHGAGGKYKCAECRMEFERELDAITRIGG